jgi:DNA-binding NarL/FixJ family response regulator
MSPLLSEIIIQSIRKGIELEVVAKIDDRSAVEESLRHTNAELIMIGLRVEETDAIASTILEIKPRATVVVFSPDCRNACLHKVEALPTSLIPLNPDKLANAIRTSLSRRR